MSSVNYENQILNAIETIVNNAVSKANYDRTIRGVISKCVDESTGKYVIRYQNSSFYAYGNAGDNIYAGGTPVYVMIPSNDMSQRKTIVGSVSEMGSDYITISESAAGYEVIGNNVISSDGDIGLCSYTPNGETIVLYDKDDEENALIDINTFAATEYLQKSNYLMVGADFRTNLTTEQKLRGNYGLAFDLSFNDNNGGDPITRTYIIDINNMVGNPYEFSTATNQKAVFEIDGENFKTIDKVYIFEYNFPNEDENITDEDIFISNFSLEAAEALSAQELSGYSLTLVTPQGIYFDDNDLDSATRRMEAIVKIRGKVVNPESNLLKYYWFKENNKVTSTHENYNRYGGAGWECLNTYTSAGYDSEDHELKEWNSDIYYKIVSKQDNPGEENSYKCVVLYNDTTIIEKEITFYNYSSDYEITIESDSGNYFYYDVGHPTLTCYVNGESQTDPEWTYQWGMVDNNNQYTILEETSNVTQEDLMKIEKNTIHNLLLSMIVNFSTFKCFVYKNNNYVGKASISIVNSRSVAQNTYSLIIENGNQIFKYNEDGISPVNKSLENPQEIYPLSFTLFDEMGREVNKDVIKTKDISWIVPERDTMIKISNVHGNPVSRNERDGTATYTQYKELYFDIATLYNAKNTRNTIQLIVKYKDKILSAKTNLSFLKEGENGSNGTNFICRIIPNVADLSTVNGYPTVYYDKDAIIQTGRNPIINYTPLGANIWFKVEFWHDGERIYNGVQSGTSTEGKSVNIQWSMLKNKYTTLQLDQSNYSVDINTGAFSFNPLTINSGDSEDEIKKKINPANIVKCTVTYDNQVYYATMPLITVIGSGTDYKGFLKEYTGFRYAMYTTDGILPTYDNTNPFTLDIFKNDENISLNDDLVYNWDVKGLVLYDGWTEENNLMEKNVYGQNLELNQANYKPIDAFNGYCVSNALGCNIEEDNNEILYIHIPIQLYLNRFGNPAMNSWDGNHIEINNDGGFILSPQVGAGTKDENNAFTGVFMGEIQESGKKSPEYGLYGYHQGERTIALNSEDGSARFGKAGKGQIVLDPTDDTAVLRSGDYEPAIVDGSGNILSPGAGLEIDLTDPHIYFGSGKFRVDKNGDVYADGFATIQDLSAGNYNVPGTENFKVICATDTVQFETNAEHYPTQAVTKTITCRCLYKDSVTSDYTVTLVDSNGNTITHNTNSDGIEFNLTKSGNTTTISFAAATSRIITNAINNFFIKFTHTSSGLDLTKVFYANLVILGADGQDGEVGPPGPAGKDGTSVTVKGTYPSVTALCNAVSAGTITPTFGDGYVIGNDLYIFTDGAGGGGTLANDWNDVGQFKGEDAKRCFIVASSEVFKSSDGGTSYTPNSVTITPYLQAVNFSSWSYSTNGGSSFTNLTSPYPSGISINNNIITLTKDCSLFTNAVSTISFKCSTDNIDVYDILTVTKIKDGIDGVAGRGISSTEIKYVADSQGVTPPNDTANWSINPPSGNTKGQYIWTRTRITYTDGQNPTTSYSVAYKGTDGTNGNSITISSQSIEYAQGEDGITVPSSGWNSNIPNVDDGKYLWTRTIVNYSDGNSTTSYTVSYQSVDGTDGIDATQYYTYVRYSKNANGSNYVTTPTSETIYIGVYVGTSATVPAYNDSGWKWSKYVGEDGTNGSDGTDGFSIWTTTAAPSNNIYTRNQLVGPSASQNPRAGEIIIRSNRYQYTITAVNGNNITVGTAVDLRGSNGTSATNIVCGNEAQTIPCDSTGKVSEATIITIPFAGYVGNAKKACSVTASSDLIGDNKDIVITTNTAGTTSADGSLVLTIKKDAVLGNENNGEITLTFTCNSLTFVKKFAWAKAIQGAQGTPGIDGVSPFIAYLTNEAQMFVYGTAKDITTQLYAYQGTTEKTVTIKTVNGVTASTTTTATGKTGMNFKVNSTSATAHPTITFSATTGLAQGQTEQLAIVFRVTGESSDRTLYFSYSSTTRGAAGTNASLVDISASTQVFKSTDGGTSFSPDTIVLTPRFQTVTYSKWQYTIGTNTPVDVVSGQNGLTLNGSVLTISKNSNLFNTNSSVTFSCISSNSSIYDTMTIVKLYDVGDIEIGGRNLLLKKDVTIYGTSLASGESLDTSEYVTSGKVVYTRSTSNNLGFYVDKYYLMEPNTDYLISFKAKQRSGSITTFFMHGESPNNVASSSLIIDGVQKSTNAQNTSIAVDLSDGNYHSFVWSFKSASSITTGQYLGNILQWNKSTGVAFSVEIKDLKWEKGNKPTDWSPAPEDVQSNIEDVQSNIENMQIGGRNYILNSNFSNNFKKWGNWGTPSQRKIMTQDKKQWMYIEGTGDARWQGVSQNTYTSDNIKIDGNKKYTFSARVKGAEANQVFTVGFHWFTKNSTSIATQNWKSFTIGTNEQIVSWTIDVGNYDHFAIMAGVDSTTTIYKVYFTELKFEEGNKVTSWTPAPEDIQNDMNDLQIGGRNLLRGTKEPVLDTYHPPTFGTMSGGNGTFSVETITDSPVPLLNKTFRISNNTSGNRDFAQSIEDFEIQGTEGKWMFSTYVRGIGDVASALIRVWSSSQRFNYSRTISTDWERIEIPVTITGFNTNDPARIQFGIGGVGSIEYIGPKLERGDKVTDWTPAPEDAEDRMDIADAQMIVSTIELYAVTESAALPSEDAWVITDVTPNDIDKYVWVKTRITYGDGHVEETTPVRRDPLKVIISVNQVYARGSVDAQPNINLFKPQKPTYDYEHPDIYIWVGTQTIWSDGSSEITDIYCDMASNKIQTELTKNYADILGAINNGTVKIQGGSIYILGQGATENSGNAIVLNSAGIGFCKNGWKGAVTSVWSIEGDFDAQNINVKNLSADLIQNGILKLGKNQGSATNTGEVELYNETDDIVVKLNKDGIRVNFVDKKSYWQVSPSEGVKIVDANGNIVYKISNTELNKVVTKNIKSEESILVGPSNTTRVKMIAVNGGLGFIAASTAE